MWDGVKSLGSRKRTSSLTRRHAMKGNGTEDKILPKGKGPNNSKVQVSNPKEILSRKGLLLKRLHLRGMLMGSPKECVSIAMKWGITPKIALNPN
jgi:hypothetical protein